MGVFIDRETFLKHYGVLGMKWGIRKDRRSKKKAARAAVRNRSSLSDAEISDRIKRIKMELELKNLSEVNYGKSAGSFVSGILKKSATQSLTAFTTKEMLKALNALEGAIASAVKK